MQNAARKMYYYTCPFVIVQAVAFLLFFSKLSFYSRLVNWIAISTFAIYLLHSQHYFGKMFYENYIKDVKIPIIYKEIVDMEIQNVFSDYEFYFNKS